METKTKIFIAAGVLLLIGGGAAIYFYIKKKQDEADAEAKRLQAELNAVQLEAINQAQQDEAETAALAALFPTEPIIGGTQVNALGNANNTLSGGTGNAVAAESTAGKQLIALQKAIMSQNVAIVEQAKGRAGINSDMIFSGIDTLSKDKISQTIQIRTGWNGQPTTFPIPTRAKDVRDFTKMMAWGELCQPNIVNPSVSNLQIWNQKLRQWQINTSGKIFDLPDLNYSPFTPDGLMMPNPPAPSGTPQPTATKLKFGDGKPDTPFPQKLYFADKPNLGKPVDLRTFTKVEIAGIVYPVVQGEVQWQQSEESPTNQPAQMPPIPNLWNDTNVGAGEKLVKNWSAAALLLDESLENLAKEILLQQNRIFFAN